MKLLFGYTFQLCVPMNIHLIATCFLRQEHLQWIKCNGSNELDTEMVVVVVEKLAIFNDVRYVIWTNRKFIINNLKTGPN